MKEAHCDNRFKLLNRTLTSPTQRRKGIAFQDNRKNNIAQRAVIPALGANPAITADLNVIDAGVGGAATVVALGQGPLATICNGVIPQAVMNSIFAFGVGNNNGCWGISKDAGGQVKVETGLYNGVHLDQNPLPNVTSITTRPPRLHCEPYHVHHHNAAHVWATQNNCYFCYGYLANNGIPQQGLRANPFPDYWTHPANHWQIVNVADNYKWTIINNGMNAHYAQVQSQDFTAKKKGPGHLYDQKPRDTISKGTPLSFPRRTYIPN